jgi:hypothetical protein
MPMARLFLIAILLTGYVTGAAAWGANGHAIIAELAERRLTPGALARIEAVLGSRRSLASVSGWADYIQFLRPETRNWHFVNIPYAASGFDEERDCAPQPTGDCIVSALARAEAVLRDGTQPLLIQRDALLFLIHLTGDAHQPLHCADRGDAGGTKRQVTFFGAPTNLHFVWDVSLIERRTFYWGEYVEALEKTLKETQDFGVTEAGRPLDWVSACHRLGVDVAYDIPADGALGDEYYLKALPVVERQLAIAGVRLAHLLNDIYDPPSGTRP